MRNFSTQFAWDRNSLSQTDDTVSSVPCLIDKGMFRKSISTMNDGKAAGLQDQPKKLKENRQTKQRLILFNTNLINILILAVHLFILFKIYITLVH